MGLIGQKAALPQAMAQLAGRPGTAVIEVHVTTQDLGNLSADEGIVRASQDHGADDPREGAHVAADHLAQVRRGKVTPLDASGKAWARDRDDLAVAPVGGGKLLVLVKAQGDVCCHDEDAAVAGSLRRGLERWLDANDGQVRVCATQRGGGSRGSRVARYDNGLGAVRHKPLHDVLGELEHAGLGLLAVRGVGGVSKVVEVLVRKFRNQGSQHADAADPRVKHADKPTHARSSPKNEKKGQSLFLIASLM